MLITCSSLFRFIKKRYLWASVPNNKPDIVRTFQREIDIN